MTERDQRHWLRSSEGRLTDGHDVCLLDLDGTVYLGSAPVRGAKEALAAARSAGLRTCFVTNNASRPAADIADQLRSSGVPCTPADVVTSAQAAARLVADQLPTGAQVLVVGGEGLVDALTAERLAPVDRASAGVRAVVQGWAPDVDWRMLAEGAYALAEGAWWVATNTDLTLPTHRGIAPGNGSLVGVLSQVTGRIPDLVAGKPAAPMLLQAAERFTAAAPLVVGDRLDTDIAGANAAGMPSLLVLTGVSGPLDLLAAEPAQRPTYVAADLRGLLLAHLGATRSGDRWACGTAWAAVGPGGNLESSSAATGTAHVDDLVACAAAAWAAADRGRDWTVDESLKTLLGRVPADDAGVPGPDAG